MNRLGIFCFYESDGNVYDYVEYLLQELAKNVSSLYIIVNGEVNDEGRARLQKYARTVIVRENSGYDGGAYADFIVNHMSMLKISLTDWDEVVFANNTFFGPLVPLADIFAAMENNAADFWGIRCVDRRLYKFIETYFLVIRKRILSEGALLTFFRQNLAALIKGSYSDALVIFERGIFADFVYKGYSYAALVNNCEYDIFRAADINISEYNVPLLKKKCLNMSKFSESLVNRCLDIIEKTNYDTNLVLEYYRSIYGRDFPRQRAASVVDSERSTAVKVKKYQTTAAEIKSFLAMNHDIYIYGAGLVAGQIYYIFKQYIQNMKGFVVTGEPLENVAYGHMVYSIGEIPDGANIIVALSHKHTQEVLPSIRNKYNIILLWNM